MQHDRIGPSWWPTEVGGLGNRLARGGDTSATHYLLPPTPYIGTGGGE